MFSLDLPKPTPELLVAGAVVLAVLVILLVVGAVITGPGGIDISLGLKPPHFDLHKRPSADKSREDQLRHAVEKMGDLAKGLGLVADADPGHETAARNWFAYLLQNLAPALAKGNGDNFRIAIWTLDAKDPESLIGLAWFNFDPNEGQYKKLERRTTVAGFVADHGEAHYCRENAKDTLYRRRKDGRGRRSKAKSMLAVPLGEPSQPWAVLTVDVNRVDGLTDTQQEVVAAFGDLATLGAHLATLDIASGDPKVALAPPSEVAMMGMARKGGRSRS
jgi:hypothetical protein